jgi:hypothetical protein
MSRKSFHPGELTHISREITFCYQLSDEKDGEEVLSRNEKDNFMRNISKQGKRVMQLKSLLKIQRLEHSNHKNQDRRCRKMNHTYTLSLYRPRVS